MVDSDFGKKIIDPFITYSNLQSNYLLASSFLLKMSCYFSFSPSWMNMVWILPMKDQALDVGEKQVSTDLGSHSRELRLNLTLSLDPAAGQPHYGWKKEHS